MIHSSLKLTQVDPERNSSEKLLLYLEPMAGIVRKKRVTHLLDHEARALFFGADARLLSCVSSGSEHPGDGDDDGDSPCLSELVHDFLEDNEMECRSLGKDLDSEQVDSVSDCAELMEDILGSSFANSVDPYRKLLLSHVSEAVETFSFLRGNVSVLRGNVVALLREKGYNAAICKTKWDSSCGVTAGNHEFIDVVQSGSFTWQKRYFVDLDFTAQFEIARPTSQYTEILSALPCVFVGTAEELKCTVRAICVVAKRCFGCTGLSVPPWRKNRYMQNKWFAPYRRTTNPVSAVVNATPGTSCRLVGFYDVVSEATRHGGAFVRTR